MIDLLAPSHIHVGNPTGHYRSFKLRKRTGGYRWIDSPSPELKKAQYELLEKLSYVPVHEAACGFIRGVGVLKGVRAHYGAKVLLNLDIKDFFPSVKKVHLYKSLPDIFRALAIPDEKWSDGDIKRFIELVTHMGSLPQGAPTSPVLANIVFKKLDEEIDALATSLGYVYTRYADDMSFSTTDSSKDIGELISPIAEILRKGGFKIKYKKTRIQRPHRRMDVTSVVINDEFSVPRNTRRNFEACIHNIWINKTPISTLEKQKLKGYFEWMRQVKQMNSTFMSRKPNWFLKVSGKVTQITSKSWPANWKKLSLEPE